MSTEKSRRHDRLRACLAPPEALGAGSYVSDHVRLTEPIARGGMGTVWRAEHVTLGIPVAVKLMSEAAVNDPAALDRFREEAAAASRLKSTHVVRVIDSGLTDGEVPYLVMELLAGEDLGARLARAGVADIADVVRWITQAARGLAAAHAEGIVHRDIKPQNLFLTDVDGEETVKLLDFGIARSRTDELGAMTATAQVIGTPFYMSPEQLTSPKSVDARTDLWSLAVVAYEALTGKLPFDGQTIGALAVAMDRRRFDAPSRVRPALPRALDAWFERALSPDPAERPRDAGSLAATFAAAVQAPSRRYLWPGAALLAAAITVAAISVSASPERAARTAPEATDPAPSPERGAPAANVEWGEPPTLRPASSAESVAASPQPPASGSPPPRPATESPTSRVMPAHAPSADLAPAPDAPPALAPPLVAPPPSATAAARKDRGF